MLVFVDDRKQIKIFVTPSAKRVIEEFADQFDMKEQGVASRIYNWFGSLPLPVQKWITGLTTGDEGKGMKDFARLLMEGEHSERPPKTEKVKFDKAVGKPIPRSASLEDAEDIPRKRPGR